MSGNLDLDCLRALERKVLWLSTWMIHNANHVRPNRDGLKVGGHQASSASLATVMTALYFHVLRPHDRVAVKPHASPVLHAILYLLGRQQRDKLERFRAFGGAQSYPSRSKDGGDVDFSTGSVGLGVAATTFASLVQDYLHLRGALGNRPVGRMVALMGDAEIDEGNVFEAMLEGWKHDARNLWWIVDYNRQSLDNVVSDRMFARVDDVFRTTGWDVVILKYGKLLEAAFRKPGGDALRQWIDDCPNSLYSALVYQGGAAWRKRLERDLNGTNGIKALLDEHDDAALGRLMTNLAGHDLETVLEAFNRADDDRARCFITYTIKGHGLPFAGHKDNHAGLMNPEQMSVFRKAMRVPEGSEWDHFAGLDLPAERIQAFLEEVPFAQGGPRVLSAPQIPVPPIALPRAAKASTQEAFGRILDELGRGESELAGRIVTTSPDVTVSTNLGPWVNRRGVFQRHSRDDTFRAEKVASVQRWNQAPDGQHIELGIAENNLFLMLAALGLSDRLFGARLIPVGTLYDPFIMRGLDALNYACYQDARFMLVATPAGITLAPEGGAHQSIATPLIGLAQDRLSSYEPAFADELATIMHWGFDHMQARDGGSIYLRLSTRHIAQPERQLGNGWADGVIAGAYWAVPPEPGAEIAIVYMGPVAPEAMQAFADLREDVPGAGLLAVTSAQRLERDWRAAQAARRAGEAAARAPVEQLLSALARDAALVTVLDGHPATLAWLSGVGRHRVHALGVDHFGQSADIPDLYRAHGLDSGAILDACAAACLGR
jgi:pyruvate dehydrogenase E1 component